jgi:hypothetical protein
VLGQLARKKATAAGEILENKPGDDPLGYVVGL